MGVIFVHGNIVLFLMAMRFEPRTFVTILICVTFSTFATVVSIPSLVWLVSLFLYMLQLLMSYEGTRKVCFMRWTLVVQISAC